MSLERQQELTCPKCGHQQSATIWDSLNADVSPEARQALFAGKINTFECASCAVRLLIPVPLMYHDMTRQFVVQYFPFEALDDPEFVKRFDTDGTDRMVASAFKSMPAQLGNSLASSYMQHAQIVFDMAELVRYVLFRERVAAQNDEAITEPTSDT